MNKTNFILLKTLYITFTEKNPHLILRKNGSHTICINKLHVNSNLVKTYFLQSVY